MTYRTLYTLLLTGLMFVFSQPCIAQENGNNERSTIVENFEGKPFYIHFVKEGQTLYNITKIYGVTSEVLVAENPDLKEGLKTDMILKIPFKDTTVVEVKNKPAPLFKKKDTSTITQAVKSNSQIVYEIKRGETLYGLAKRFDVSMDDILNANQGITSFKTGTKIRIPVNTQENVQATVTSKTSKSIPENSKVVNAKTPSKDTNLKTSESKPLLNKTTIIDQSLINTSKKFRVAMLIPFYLEDIDSIRNDQPEPKSFAFVQFYEASLLAVDSLRKQGMDVKLFVYDSDGDEGTEKTKAIFQKKELADMDLIIGPFYAKCFDIASKYAGLHKIPIVNPLSKRNEIITVKPWVFKVQPTQAGQMTEVAEYINLHSPNANVVLIRADKTKMTVEANAFKDGMQMVLRKQSQLNNFKESFFVAEGIPGLSLKLSTNNPNILVVLSSDEVFVSDLLRKLEGINSDIDLTVMGMASWEQFKLDVNAMMHVKMQFYSNKYVDFSSAAVQNFTSKFLKEYNTVPEVKKYGFDGFDITYYFLSALMKYGRQFGREVGDYSYKGLQNSFHFHKIEGGGYENSAVNFYKLEDNTLKKVL